VGKTTNVVLSFFKCKKHLHFSKKEIECKQKQQMEATNASLLVPFHKLKNCRMPNKIFNKLKNLSQQATGCLHFALPKTFDPCTFEALHNSVTTFFKITFHCTH